MEQYMIERLWVNSIMTDYIAKSGKGIAMITNKKQLKKAWDTVGDNHDRKRKSNKK